MYDEIAHDVILRESDGCFVCRRCGLFNPGEEDSCVTSTTLMKAMQTTPEVKQPKAA